MNDWTKRRRNGARCETCYQDFRGSLVPKVTTIHNFPKMISSKLTSFEHLKPKKRRFSPNPRSIYTPRKKRSHGSPQNTGPVEKEHHFPNQTIKIQVPAVNLPSGVESHNFKSHVFFAADCCSFMFPQSWHQEAAKPGESNKGGGFFESWLVEKCLKVMVLKETCFDFHPFMNLYFIKKKRCRFPFWRHLFKVETWNCHL